MVEEQQLKLFQEVKVNENAKRFMPMDIGLQGRILEINATPTKYYVSLRDGTTGWFTEEELDII